MDPMRMAVILAPRPTAMISWKIQTLSALWRIPRTAELTMCVIGEVILILNTPAIERSQPTIPVTRDPQKKRARRVISSSGWAGYRLPERSFDISGPSPTSQMMGMRATELRTFEYHESWIASPFTAGKLRLITIAWDAVVTLERRPKNMPMYPDLASFGVADEDEGGSRKTPIKKPRVTHAQATKTWCDGLVALRKMIERITVKGRTRPRAT
jgi:hypothetical protein